MAGKIKSMIDTIIQQQGKGSKIREGVVKMKMILKGVDPKQYAVTSHDDPLIMGKLVELMATF